MKKSLLIYYYSYQLTLSSTHSVPRLLTQLINALSEDFDVTTLEYHTWNYALNTGIKSIKIPIADLKEKIKRIIGSREKQKSIRKRYTRRFFEKNKTSPDIVLVLSFLDFDDVINLFPKAKKIFWVHDFSIPTIQAHLTSLNRMNYLISPSNKLIEEMEAKVLPDQITTKILRIPNWVSSNLLLLRCINKMEARKKFEIPSSSSVFIFVGGDSPLKGSHIIEEILSEVASEKHLITIIKAGTNNITRKRNDHLLILEVGKLSPDDLAVAYASADFGLFPSQVFENLPLAIIEMIMFNILPVASDIGGVSELLGSNYPFLVKDISSTKAWIEKINYLFSATEDFKEILLNEMQAFIVEEYSFQNAFNNWKVILNN